LYTYSLEVWTWSTIYLVGDDARISSLMRSLFVLGVVELDKLGTILPACL
jgi:hypothetical protein